MEDRPTYRASGRAIIGALFPRRQRWLAVQLGMAETDLSAIVRGRKPITFATAEKIAAVLDVAPEWIVEAQQEGPHAA